ncbi:MAG: transposase, partial [Myxococcaceae bacterium]
MSLERLSRREDGQYEYRTKRGHVLILTAAALVKRLLAVVPPSGTHLTCFHGVFAPNAALRSLVVLKPAARIA